MNQLLLDYLQFVNDYHNELQMLESDEAWNLNEYFLMQYDAVSDQLSVKWISNDNDPHNDPAVVHSCIKSHQQFQENRNNLVTIMKSLVAKLDIEKTKNRLK